MAQYPYIELYRQITESGVLQRRWMPERDPDDADAFAVYARQNITVTAGRGAEQSEPTTGTATLTFKGDEYNPRNPASSLYGTIGQNTPLRISAGSNTALLDSFTRSVTNGWNGSNGLTWSLSGGTVPDDYDVNGAEATITHTNTNTLRYATVDTGETDGRVRVIFDLSASDLTGAGASVWILARFTDVSNYYAALISYNTSEVATVALYKRVAGTLTQLSTPVTVPDTGVGGGGNDMFGELYVEGNRLYASCWRRFAGDEPIRWMTSAEDNDLTTGTRAGVTGRRETSNTNTDLQLRYHDFTAVPGTVRFTGEVASYRPRRAIVGDSWVEVTANGLLRREDRGEAPILSPFRRTITSAETVDDLLAYWPCEDESDSASAASALSGGAAMGVTAATADALQFAASQPDTFRRNMSALGFGRAVQPGTNPLPALAGGGKLTGTVPPSPNGATNWQWTVAFVAQTNAVQAGEDIIIARWFTPGGTYVRWDLVQLSSGLGVEVYGYTDEAGGGAATLATTVNSEVVLTEYRIVAFQNSTNTQVELYVAGNQEDVTNFTTTTNAQVSRVEMNPASNSVSGVSGFWVGHVQVWDTASAPGLGFSNFNQVTQETDADGVDIFPWFGWLNERAADRLDRVCRERGMPFLLTGDRIDTGRMGSQPAETFVGLLVDVERTDAGLTHEAREQLALRYRTRRSLYNQTAVTLDFTAGGEVAPPLEPDLDDLGVRNDVIVERRDGSTYRTVQQTGPRNVQRPEDDPQGVGRYGAKLDVNPVADIDLVGLGDWYLSGGTIDAIRYPQITVDFVALVADGKATLAASVAHLRVGDRLDIANLEAEGVAEMLPGYTEVIGPVLRTITFNATPAALYNIGVYNDTSRYDSAYSTTAAQITTGTSTSLSVAIEAGRSLWVTGSTGPQFPFDINLLGAQVRVTAISGTSSPQTFTISTTVPNGITKVIPSGTQVRLWDPRRYGL